MSSPPTGAAARRGRPSLALVLGVAAVVALGAGLVALTLRQPELPTWTPTAAEPRDVGRALVGPVEFTVDATDPDRWRHFSFRQGAVIDEPGPTDWDLAFRRFQIIANGGEQFLGRGGVIDLGPVAFDDVREVPTTGYAGTERAGDPHNPAIAGWYRYGFFSHVLTPKPHVYAVRTADGRYAKMEILGYYCPGARPGCVTFRYVFQGDGSPAVSPP